MMTLNDAMMIRVRLRNIIVSSFPFLSFSFLLAHDERRKEKEKTERDEGREVGEEAQRRPVESDVYRVAGFSPLITAISNPSPHQSRKH